MLGAAPAALVLALAAATALVVERLAAAAAITACLLIACLRARTARRRPYLLGVLLSATGVVALWPLLAVEGAHPLWTGPTLPVLGVLDVTVEELELAGLNGLRLAAVGLAFAAYALLLDHDRLVGSLRFARRSTLVVALATRLVPTLERDARGLAEAVRGRGVELAGVRGHARLLSPLVAGSLERSLNLAEAMEARGYGRPGATRTPGRSWTRLERLAVGVAACLAVAGAVWL